MSVAVDLSRHHKGIRHDYCNLAYYTITVSNPWSFTHHHPILPLDTPSQITRDDFFDNPQTPKVKFAFARVRPSPIRIQMLLPPISPLIALVEINQIVFLDCFIFRHAFTLVNTFIHAIHHTTTTSGTIDAVGLWRWRRRTGTSAICENNVAIMHRLSATELASKGRSGRRDPMLIVRILMPRNNQ
jgi:hypothetical protein